MNNRRVWWDCLAKTMTQTFRGGRKPVDLRYDHAADRRKKLLKRVREARYCNFAELSRELGVSQMTVRRDIDRLAEQGLVRAVRGGVSVVAHEPSPGLQPGTDFAIRARKNPAAKRAIGRRAVAMIEPASIVAVDAGTTALEIVRFMPPTLRISMVTHSLPAMALPRPDCAIEVIGLGGVLHPETQAFAGPTTIANLEELRVHAIFLGASAVRDGMMYCGNHFDAMTKRALINAADKVVLVVDASKFQMTAMVQVAPLDEVDTVVVDDAIESEVRAAIEAMNVDVIVAPTERDDADGSPDRRGEGL
jgi:DeoR/GlpR family transcriptional regulator of sugar metabolism